jgi:anaerobic ribonucleoside-triphosphate reductase
MSDNCPHCGKEKVPCCTVPGCKAHVEVYSRPCGYLRPISMFNDGKQQEVKDRTEYETWDSSKIKMDVDIT